jgi:hypothetical protein
MELCLLLISTYLLSNSRGAQFVIFLHLCFNGPLDAAAGSSSVVDCCGLKSLQQRLQCALVL